ncbi:MAG TPA: substrate-binding domain-containing protein [Solirubrobacteraceae bacterium]|nr:substrate-binding domain-containing protein [Solirubrobacteraceae bacterium]
MRRIVGLAVPWVLAAAVLGGCGSSNSSSSASSSAGATNASAGTSSNSSSSSLASYQQAIQKGQAPVTYSGPTQPNKAPAGKSLTVVTCTEALEGCKLLTLGTVHAAQAVGWRSRVVNVTDPTQYDQAVRTAVAQGTNVIVLVGIDSRLIPGGISAAHAAKVPLVSIFQYNVPGPNSVDVEVSPDANVEGKLLADSMIVDHQGKVNVLFMPDSEFSLPVHVLAAAKQELDSCKACSVSYAPEINFTAATVNTTLPGRVVSELQTHSDINSILVGFDPPSTFIIPAIDSAGLKSKVKMYTQLGTTSALNFVREGNVLSADVGASNEWGGWAAVDEAIRLLKGEKPVDEHVPVSLLVSSNLPPKGQPFVGDSAGFKQKYLAIWK